jgi:SAM-dependent methyltransferase
MDRAATLGAEYKRHFTGLLDIRPGHTVIDVGCGPGTDLAAMAGTATVIGVDRDAGMLAEARRRSADHPRVRICAGDAHALPLPAASADRVRTDRVLQHVADPAAALAEFRRVLRPGGLLGMAEPDWDTLTVADDDVETSRAFARFTAGQVRNPTLGRQLPRLAARAGFAVRTLQARPIVFRDAGVADEILGLTRNTTRGIDAGRLHPDAALPWLERLHDGVFLAAFTLYLVIMTA